MRVILYTGKGGVGKTSMAALSACNLARRGKKVLIMSTDAAHSLSDSFQVTLSREPVQVAKGLDAMEIDTIYEGEKSWAHMKEYIKRILTVRGGDGIEAEELLVFPGLEELFSMFRILDIVEEDKYDVLIVDCAPTGETLSLLQYPEQLTGFMEKVLPVKRKGAKVAGPAVEKIMKIPMPKDNVFDDLELVVERMRKLQNLMLDQNRLSIRIVTTPERIVIKEAKRNFTCMHLFDYNVDAIFVNKIYPKQAMEGYFNKWMEKQEEGLKEIEESFSEIPKFYFELQNMELCGKDCLFKKESDLFEDVPIEEILFQKKIYEYHKEQEDSGTLKIYLPFVDKEELDLRQNGDEIVLAVKNEQRRFPLPIDLRDMEIVKAKCQDDYLILTFERS